MPDYAQMMSRVTPWVLLIAVSGVMVFSLGLTIANRIFRAGRALREARRLGLQFSGKDRFDLAARVAGRLPIPGAAELTVWDVAYETTPAGIVCVMTASFTIGTVGHRRHLRRVCAVLDTPPKQIAGFLMLEGAAGANRYEEALREIRALVQKTPR